MGDASVGVFPVVAVDDLGVLETGVVDEVVVVVVLGGELDVVDGESSVVAFSSSVDLEDVVAGLELNVEDSFMDLVVGGVDGSDHHVVPEHVGGGGGGA